MKKGDFLWWGVLLSIVAFLLYPSTREGFVAVTKAHPYIMGFIKVGILATMGELMAIRIASGDFSKPKGLIYRFVIWGLLGMLFALMFDVFAMGTAGAIKKGLLPSGGEGTLHNILTAFFTSAVMNLFFAPTFMAFHRVTDTYIDLGEGKLSSIVKVPLSSVVDKIDWRGFIGFVILKTVPLFWIPAHTITFILPGEYRVLMAAFLSIALGGIMAATKKSKGKEVARA